MDLIVLGKSILFSTIITGFIFIVTFCFMGDRLLQDTAVLLIMILFCLFAFFIPGTYCFYHFYSRFDFTKYATTMEIEKERKEYLKHDPFLEEKYKTPRMEKWTIAFYILIVFLFLFLAFSYGSGFFPENVNQVVMSILILSMSLFILGKTINGFQKGEMPKFRRFGGKVIKEKNKSLFYAWFILNLFISIMLFIGGVAIIITL